MRPSIYLIAPNDLDNCFLKLKMLLKSNANIQRPKKKLSLKHSLVVAVKQIGNFSRNFTEIYVGVNTKTLHSHQQ